MAEQGSQVRVGERLVRVTNLAKVMYPDTGTTKGDVIAYYQAVADAMVPHVRRRPATRKRWPHGVGTASDPHQPFFHKNQEHAPDWVETVTLQHSDAGVTYPLVDDAATLVWLAQLAALEIHVPQWRVDADLTPQNPDRLVLDMDPGVGAGMEQCVELAHLLRGVLDGVGFASVPVTSGSKGIHLYAALDGSMTSDEASGLALDIARSLEALHPDLVVSDMKKSAREGKVLLDWSQNNGAKTTIAPYSLRGRSHPCVAAPRTWDEIEPGLGQLEFDEVLERLASIGDPMGLLLPDAVPAPGAERVEVTEPANDSAAQPADDPAAEHAASEKEPVHLPTIEPMLATPGTAADVQGDGWTFEVKWDGYRMIASVGDGTIALHSRRGLDYTREFPELRELADLLAGHTAVLDGEVVALDDAGRPSFELLQNRGARPGHAQYMVFDVLHLDGRSLIRTPWHERRAILAELIGAGSTRVHLSTVLGTDADDALAASADLGLEGVLAKRTDSVYQPGRRGHTWIKIKHVLAQEVVIVGWAPGENARARTIGALLMAVPGEGGVFDYVGRVGTGFTERALADAREVLSGIEIPDAPVAAVPAAEARGVHWVEPLLVGEVTYGVWTSVGRLRMPVWKGWRPDKGVEDIRMPEERG